MKSLVLIDLSHLFRAAWHASEDQDIGAAYSRTLADVRRFARDFDLCAVCCDAPPYRRKSISAQYKAQRDNPPPQLTEQLTRTKERLTSEGFLLWSAPGYEADDIIATAVARASTDEAIGSIRIVSSDKDLLALVNDDRNVTVYSPRSQVEYKAADVVAKFGVTPVLMPEYLALVGDKSDNVPGVPGVGDKKAAMLLHDYPGGIAELQARSETIPGAIGKAVHEHREAMGLALRLVTLEYDAPIDFDQLFAERTPRPLAQDAEWEPAPETPKSEQAPHVPEATVIREPHQVTQLAIRPQEWTMALEPTSTKDAFTMAKHLHNSRLFQAYGTPEAVFAVVLRGRALGLDAVTSLSNFHIIEGKPSMHAALIVGLVHRSGKARHFQLTESTNERATWKTHRIGDPDPVAMSFSIEDAFLAGLVTRQNGEYRGVSRTGKASNWDKYRRTMLRWRAAVELARAVYPDIVTGLYTPDEVSDGREGGE